MFENIIILVEILNIKERFQVQMESCFGQDQGCREGCYNWLQLKFEKKLPWNYHSVMVGIIEN